MADTKVSALTAAAAALTTHEIPVNESGASKKVTVAQIQTLLAAVQATQETGTSTLLFVTPGVQQFHPSAAKFWAQVTGAGSPALTTNYNVTSVADTNTGRMTITIGTDFSSANWCCVNTGISNGTTVGVATIQWVAAIAAGTVEIDNADLSATPIAEDPAVGYDTVGFGDQ